MGRAPCCDKANVKKGPWSHEEDEKLKDYIAKFGTGGNWIALPEKAGLKRCGKSCRFRWLNYLRPNIKHGDFSYDEDQIICQLFATIGSRWSIIAAQLPGRTDNDIKNYWNTKLKKKFMGTANQHHKATCQSSTANQPILQTSLSPSIFSVLSSSCLDDQIITSPSTLLGISSNTLTSSSSILQRSQDGHLNPMQNYLMFGGSEASCSSSDGSCSNQISHGEKQGIMDKYCYFYNGIEEHQKIMISNSGGDELIEKPDINNGFGGASGLEYELEEIEKLISSNNIVYNNFFLDENNI